MLVTGLATRCLVDCRSGDSRWRDVSDLRRVGPQRTFDRSRIARHEAKPARLEAVAETTSGTRAFAELLIDCEEDRTLRAVLVGILREGEG